MHFFVFRKVKPNLADIVEFLSIIIDQTTRKMLTQKD